MQVRIQAMFLAAFAIAYAMLLTSLAAADGPQLRTSHIYEAAETSAEDR